MLFYIAFDKDGDGFITTNELRIVMAQCGDRLSEEDVQKMMKAVDINGDGVLEYSGKFAMKIAASYILPALKENIVKYFVLNLPAIFVSFVGSKLLSSVDKRSRK